MLTSSKALATTGPSASDFGVTSGNWIGSTDHAGRARQTLLPKCRAPCGTCLPWHARHRLLISANACAHRTEVAVVGVESHLFNLVTESLEVDDLARQCRA